MICEKPGHLGGEHCVTCVEHATFKAAAERRKVNGMRNRRFSIMCDEAAVVSISDFWEGWVEHLGKQNAVDYLIISMRKADEALRAAMERRKKK
jgi:hypothetical protein